MSPGRKVNRWIIGVGVAMLALGGIVVFQTWQERVYKGKSVSAWLADIPLVHGSGPRASADRDEAVEAIRHFGPDIIPRLIAYLKYDEPSWLRDVKQWLDDKPWCPFDFLTEQERNMRASWAFQALGARAKPAIPDLVGILGENPGFVPGALVHIGAPAIPAITNALDHTNKYVRWNLGPAIANAIHRGDMNRETAEATVPHFVRNLKDPSSNGRAHALIGLKVIQRKPEIVVPPVRSLLNDPSASVRQRAIDVLKAYRARDKATMNKLTDCLDDPDATVRTKALAALSEISPSSVNPETVRSIIDRFGGMTVPQKMEAIRGLGSLTSQADIVVPFLIEVLKNDSSEVIRFNAAQRLRHFPAKASIIKPALRKALEDSSDAVERTAKRSLRELSAQ